MIHPFTDGASPGHLEGQQVLIDGTMLSAAACGSGFMLGTNAFPMWWLRCSTPSHKAAWAMWKHAIKGSVVGITGEQLKALGWIRVDVAHLMHIPKELLDNVDLLEAMCFARMHGGTDAMTLATAHMEFNNRRHEYIQLMGKIAVATLSLPDPNMN